MQSRRGKREANPSMEIKATDTPEVVEEKKQVQAQKQQRRNLKKYANLYVKKKAILMPLLVKYSKEQINPDATHGELIRTYIHLLRDDPAFGKEIDGLMVKYNNAAAVDPVSAIAQGIGELAGMTGKIFDVRNTKLQAEADQEAMLYGMILEGQKDNSTRNILIISGISVVAVGAMIYFISKRKK